MGNRVHVVKKQCTYGDTEAFNWSAEEFANLLGVLGVAIETVVDYDYSQFECDVEEYKKALRIIRAVYKANGDEKKIKRILKRDEIDEYDFKCAVKDTKYTIKELYEIMNDYFQERDKRSGWMQFHSW